MPVATKKKLLRIWLESEIDPNPDLSYLGEYSDRPAQHHIDRKKRKHQGRQEYRYFNLGLGDPEYLEQDYKRMEAYNREVWCVLWHSAAAELEVNGVVQTVRSGGVNAESDADEEYVDTLRLEQLDELRSILKTLGISPGAIRRAVDNMETSRV